MKCFCMMISTAMMMTSAMGQDLDFDSLLGEEWYGLYLNGGKAGYAYTAVEKDDSGQYVVTEDAKFQINMVSIKQDMRTVAKRIYGPDGALRSIESRVVDPVRETLFVGRVEGEEFVLSTTVLGNTTIDRLPVPEESLIDAVKHARWVMNDPKPGETLSFSLFEPLYKEEVSGMSHLIGTEERLLDGVPTKVYEIKTSLDKMNIDSVSYVAENGTTLEDIIAGMITMRLEPEHIAKDVDYNNDVIVSNAALIDAPIENARQRVSLRLKLKGPLTEDHLFIDERQFIQAEGDGFRFEAKRVSLDDVGPVLLPVTDEDALRWTKPTAFIQSEHPDLITKAREIVGSEIDAFKIVEKLCAWVDRNVKNTFSARLTNALEVIESLEGDCTEHSVLFIGLCRALGVPAREVAGLIYVDEDGAPGFYFHQWATVWVGKWIDVDPTFNQPLADVTHIKLSEGDLYRQARLIPIIGKISIEVVDE